MSSLTDILLENLTSRNRAILNWCYYCRFFSQPNSPDMEHFRELNTHIGEVGVCGRTSEAKLPDDSKWTMGTHATDPDRYAYLMQLQVITSHHMARCKLGEWRDQDANRGFFNPHTPGPKP